MNTLRSTVVTAVAWTALQALVYVIVFEGCKAVYSIGFEWRPDVGRGILWYYAMLLFLGLALVANLILTRPHVDSLGHRKLFVWSVVFIPVVVLTAPSARSAPLATLLVWVCAVVSIAVREALGGLRRRRASSP